MDHHFSAFDNSLRAWVMYVLNRLHILVAYNDLLCMLIEEYNIVTRLVMNPIKTIKEYNRISFKLFYMPYESFKTNSITKHSLTHVFKWQIFSVTCDFPREVGKYEIDYSINIDRVLHEHKHSTCNAQFLHDSQ